MGSGDQFVKTSEYAKEFPAKTTGQIPGTDLNIYERPSEHKNEWKKSDLHMEKESL